MQQFDGRVAVVTGAGSGIGRALAQRFADEGMKVALADVQQDALDTAVDELRAGGAEVIGVRTDVSRRADIEALAAATIDAFGAVHVLCNNAGVESGAPFSEIADETWDWVIGVNLRGVITGTQVFLPLLRQQDEGHIVNTSSLAGLNAFMPTSAPYVATKFAVLGISELLQYELETAGEPIGVSVLCPGMVNTRMPDSERNLPPGVPAMDDHPSRRKLLADLRAGAHTGMPAAECAGLVFDAIRDNRFYVLTHPEPAYSALEGRLRWMKTNERPVPPPGIDRHNDVL